MAETPYLLEKIFYVVGIFISQKMLTKHKSQDNAAT